MEPPHTFWTMTLDHVPSYFVFRQFCWFYFIKSCLWQKNLPPTVTSSASDIHVSDKLFEISSSLACKCAASLKKSPKMNQISINANDESMISISANTLYIRCTYAQINVI